MRKLLSLFAVLMMCGAALAADVRVSGATTYGVLARGSSWSNYTGAGLTFVFDALTPSAGVCVTMINNNPTNTRTVILSSAITSDQSVTTFTGNQGNWSTVPVSPPQSTYVIPVFSTSATGTFQIYLRAVAASHLAFTISGETGTAGGVPDTVTILYAWSGSQCGGVNQWNLSEIEVAASCNTAAGVIAGVPGVRHVANCVSVSANTAVATAFDTTFKIIDGGTAGSCTGTVRWNGTIGFSAAIGNAANIAICGLNVSSSPGNSLQVCSSSAPAASQQCASSMSGYDQ